MMPKRAIRMAFISDILKIGADIKTAKEVISAIMQKCPRISAITT